MDDARDAKPELAKAEDDVCGLLLLRPEPNMGFGDEVRDLLDSLSEECVGETSDASLESAFVPL